MKLLIVFFMCIYFALSLKLNPETIEKWSTMIHPHVEGCFKKTGVKKEFADNIYTNLDYPDDQKFKCYMDCLVHELGLLDSNNKLDKKKLKEVHAAQEELVEECIKKAEQFSKPCEVGYMFAYCGIRGIAKSQNP